MADEQVSKTGVFIDAKTGKVVNSQPEEGYQIVPPGGIIDANAQAQIEAAKAAQVGEDEDSTVPGAPSSSTKANK